MGKKSRRRDNKGQSKKSNKEGKDGSDGTGGTKNLGSKEVLFERLMLLIKVAESLNASIDEVFHHKHYVSMCIGYGTVHLLSQYQFNHDSGAFITHTIFHVHDNIRAATFGFHSSIDESDRKIREMLVPSITNGLLYREAPYAVCSKLIRDCMLRMYERKRILQGHDEKACVRLYGLKTTIPPCTFEEAISLPSPGPAPSVESLYLMLHRPEYIGWNFNSELSNHFKCDDGQLTITKELLNDAMTFIAKKEYRRNRLYGLMHYMAIRHCLNHEEEIASWLLWEVRAMQAFSDEKEALKAMVGNVVFQFMINRFFDPGYGSRSITVPPGSGIYGELLGVYAVVKHDLAESGSLAPNVLVTRGVAPDVTNEIHKSSFDAKKDQTTIREACKMAKKAGCAVCGRKKSKDGNELRECEGCWTVRYCCIEHRDLDWKAHKQTCFDLNKLPEP